MTWRQAYARTALLAMLLCCTLVARAELPGESVYRLPVTLVDQDGRSFPFSARAGRVQLVTMFYGSCQYVCPLTIDTMKKTQAALDAGQRAKLGVLLVSFDPDRDTPERLLAVLRERHLDATSWTLTRTDKASVRKLAAAFDIPYRTSTNGDINHSTALIALDPDGRILARSEKIGIVDLEFLAKVKQALDRSTAEHEGE